MKSEDDAIPLPDPSPLPKHYPHQIEEAIASGKVSAKQKRAFLSEVASSMLRFKRYPDPDDYKCVARAVLAKYPFFKEKQGKPYVCSHIAYSYIHKIL